MQYFRENTALYGCHLKHRFKRVVYGSEDPNPKHRGAAADILEQAGIKVTRGVLEKECDHLIRGFRVNMLEGRPWVIAKAPCLWMAAFPVVRNVPNG